MAAHQSSSRLRTDILELNPDVGLAEWTSKIKAMQRQVDADEEAEQIRLEEEIAASRLARIRRSQSLVYGSRTDSVDVSKLKDEVGNSSREFDAISINTPKTSAEIQSDHADTLQRLVGASSASTFTPTSKDITINKPSTYTRPLTETQPQPMSLAAFMGGRATGPRLNRHAPQQDAHDPTQFQQRAFSHAPHPAFGTGGVAMPGIAVQRDGLRKPSAVAALSKAKPSGRVSELPLTTKTYSETYERQSPSRERTTSTPSHASSNSWTTAKQAKPASPITPNLQSSSKISPSGTIVRDRDFRTRSVSPTPPLSKPVDRPVTPRQPIDITVSPSRSSVAVPSLAGLVRPQPRPSAIGPHIPTSVTPSKAFLRPPTQKEPTPSLSRLQGRGFVQSMVQVSSQLESPPSSTPETAEKNKLGSGRRSSVLDRWQPSVSPSTHSPPVSPTPRSMRRSATVDPTIMAEKPRAAPADPLKKPLKGATSNPLLRQENIPPRPSPSSKLNASEKNFPVGLGSATTLVVYKPKPIDVPTLDEFGYKPHGVPRGVKDAALDLPAPSRPLSHPTKERARKPRKQKTSHNDTSSINPESMVPDSPRPSDLFQPSNLPAVASFDASAVTAPPLKTSLRECSKSTTSTNESPQSSSADEARDSGQFADQIRRALPGFVTARQAETNVSESSAVFQTGEVEHTSNPLIRQALPGLVSLRKSGNPTLSKPAVQQPPGVDQTNHGVARHALPGMVGSAPVIVDKALETKSVTKGMQHSPLPDMKEESATVSSPPKHPRIPSTGNRLTVMDVAQALSKSEGSRNADETAALLDSPQPITANRPRSLASSSVHAEKRKSSYDKYSSIILPPLKEEATPTPTPAGSLSRKEGDVRQQMLGNGRQDNAEQSSKTPSTLGKEISRLPSSVDTNSSHEAQKLPLPGFDIDSLLKYNTRPVHLDPGTTTISVEVMAITGTTASTLAKDRTIFYDTEILAIIHRLKSQVSGLVSTTVWGWEGKRAKLGEREQRKLRELATRYGTSVDIVHQNSETPQLVHVLGGVLAIRQGTRTHWTPENTAMHLVRSLSGVILVDEKDLNIKNLCSGYSYCVSILGSVYVWYGCGSTPLERNAALEYGRSLTTGIPVIELYEGGDDDDEMFWMILGDEDYANADYWKWRRSSPIADPRIWRAKAGLGTGYVAPIDFISNETCVHDSVYIIDCIWEFYIMVGSGARAHRQDIELALHVALELSSRVSSARPYFPTIHALVLPSQLPKDLRLVFRDLDEFSVNKGEIPDHMNILSLTEAFSHLETTNWDRSALQDGTMLPLGIDTS